MIDYCTQCEGTELELTERKQVSTDVSGAKWFRETYKCARCGHLEEDYAIERGWQSLAEIHARICQLIGQMTALRRELEATIDSFSRGWLEQKIALLQAMLDMASEQIEAVREGQGQ